MVTKKTMKEESAGVLLEDSLLPLPPVVAHWTGPSSYSHGNCWTYTPFFRVLLEIKSLGCSPANSKVRSQQLTLRHTILKVLWGHLLEALFHFCCVLVESFTGDPHMTVIYNVLLRACNLLMLLTSVNPEP
jgi:hypothetical protein